MKKYFKLLKLFFALALLFSIHSESMSQPPPPPSTGHGGASNQAPGAGAPIGDGMFLLLSLAGLYSGKKIYDIRKAVAVKDL
jgi:hypothetical protein